MLQETELWESTVVSNSFRQNLTLDQRYKQLKGFVKEPNMFHNYETEKITRKASDMAEYIEMFGSSARDRHARRI